MEGVIILVLAIFLLTSAGERDTREHKDPIAAKPGSAQTQNAFKYDPSRVPAAATSLRQPGSGDYEQTDTWKIRDFIKRFKPEYPDTQIAMYTNIIIKYGKTYNIDPKLMAGLIARESSFDPKARSSSNAMGLGQIKGFHFKSLGITNPYNPEQNIKGVAILLKDLLEKWKGHKERITWALASYKEGYNGIVKNKKYSPGTEKYIKDIHGFIKDMR